MARSELLIPIIFVLAAIFYALLGLYAWRKRPALAVASFAWVMLSMSIWAFTYALEIILPSLPAKIFIINIEYLGILGAPIFLFAFTMDLIGKSHLITRRLKIIAASFAALILLMVWSNPLHNLMWDMETVRHLGVLSLFSIRFGPLFWLHILFSAFLTSSAGFLLLNDLLAHSGKLRMQILLVIISLLSSLSGLTFFVLGYSPIPGIDLSSLLFLPGAIGLAWITLQNRIPEFLSLEYLNVLKNMRHGVLVLNARHRVLYINSVAQSLLQCPEENAIGQPLSQMAGEFAPAISPYLHPQETHTEIQIERQDNWKYLEMAVAPISSRIPGQSNLLITLYDITRQKEKELELNRRSLIMTVISSTAEKFLETREWERNIPTALQNLGTAVGAARAQYIKALQISEDEFTLRLQHEWHLPELTPQTEHPIFTNRVLKISEFGGWLSALAQEHCVQITKSKLPPPEREVLEQMGSLSICGCPVFINGALYAFFVFHDPTRERHWDDMELDAFQTFANLFNAAAMQAHTEARLLRRQRDLTLLHDIIRASLQAGTMQEMTTNATEKLAKLVGANGCFLTLWDEAAARPIPFSAYGNLKKVYPKIKVPPGEKTFTQSVLAAGKTLLIDDVETTPYASRGITSKFPSRSLIALPLTTPQQKLGALLVSFEQRRSFEKDEVEICEQAAALIALALEKFQAKEEAEHRAATSESLRKAGMAVTQKNTFEDAIQHILEQLKLIIQYNSASIQLIRGDALEIVGGHGWVSEQEVIGMKFPIPGENPNTAVIQQSSAVYLPDVRARYEQFNHPPHNHIRSWLGIPLIAQDKVIGLLAIDGSTPDQFSENDIMAAGEFAKQVAITIENTRLLQESRSLAITDELTGVYNRRGLLQLGEFEFQRARRINRPISLMLFDIDHFKKINDAHGHPIGDQILRQLAQICSQLSRATDLAARYGGEEFTILLAETNHDIARIIGERLRSAIMKHPFHTEAGDLSVTVSIGIAEADKKDNLESLIKKADTALYQAKNSGRNRVVVYREGSASLDQI
ncbi:MAG: diguanylate cyclase [Chloroflexi bacterium]|nr:diguanylate cyclase [Chloroflexota bacterium]